MANLKVASLDELLARKRAASATAADESSKRSKQESPVSAGSKAQPASPRPFARPSTSAPQPVEKQQSVALAAVLSVCREGKMDRLRSTLSEHPTISLADADEDAYSFLHGTPTSGLESLRTRMPARSCAARRPQPLAAIARRARAVQLPAAPRTLARDGEARRVVEARGGQCRGSGARRPPHY